MGVYLFFLDYALVEVEIPRLGRTNNGRPLCSKTSSRFCWGTSRFAIHGNSLFGQWDFSGEGIKPEQQRAGLGNYGITAFDSPQDSIEAYMLNLNTHRAYQRMRQKCAVFRQQNKKPTGWDLAKTLDKYSERGNG
jgi:Bax protein